MAWAAQGPGEPGREAVGRQEDQDRSHRRSDRLTPGLWVPEEET